jgi:hypothetical protein
MTDPLTELDGRIARLDALIAERPDAERGLGLRLALGLARELRTGTALGSETAGLVEEWKSRFDDDVVEEAIAQARVLLRDPARLATEIGRRLEGPDDLSGVDDPPGTGAAPRA